MVKNLFQIFPSILLFLLFPSVPTFNSNNVAIFRFCSLPLLVVESSRIESSVCENVKNCKLLFVDDLNFLSPKSGGGCARAEEENVIPDFRH